MSPDKVLFACPHSLFDTTSGAAWSMRSLLGGLARRGLQVVALQATIFDTPAGAGEVLAATEPHRGRRTFRSVVSGVDHFIVRTEQTERLLMTCEEQEFFLHCFRRELERRRPDLLMLWGSLLLERHLAMEARRAGIPVVFYLANPNYRTREPFENADLIVTDTHATAELYAERLGLAVCPIGKFIDPDLFRAPVRRPNYVTFVNPIPEKGVALFLALALLAKKEAPEIAFLVVESRGSFTAALEAHAIRPDDLPNVRVLSAQPDMRRVYAETRALLVPSVWHESGPRVIAEALLNGIPVLACKVGGCAEMLAGSGFLFDAPEDVRRDPTSVPPVEAAGPWLDVLGRLVRDEAFYRAECEGAHAAAASHDLQRNVGRFLDAVSRILPRTDPRVRLAGA